MRQGEPRQVRKPLLVNLAWAAVLAAVLFVGYVLSYPIALRVCTTGERPPEMALYAPVESVIFRNEFAFNAMHEWAYWVGGADLVFLRLVVYAMDEFGT
jgi:hypothetical protein